jgi:nucleoside-diphosphate-sugar epimerase
MHSVSIIGCGYTGLKLAQRWRQLGSAVRGFATRPASLADIASVGATAQVLNLDLAPAPADLPAARLGCDDELVYYAVPPAPVGTRDTRLERLFEFLDGKPRRFVYLSTTGVYGDHGGAAVDEETPPAPRSERARLRVAAELSVRRWADARTVSWCILRVPGIYGPGRLPLGRLKGGEPAIDPAEATPSNRIHVEDLVTVCVAAGRSPRADGRIYNVTDGSDDSPTAYLQRVARITGLPPPPLVSRSEAKRIASPMAWSFLSESRRASNKRMLDELGVELAYRDLDAGIRASL